MDSSSSSSGAASRDASLVEDDGGGHISAAASLAKDAALLFQSRRYGECLDLLNQLLQKKEDDPKVLHNIAVAEYFHDGCSDPRKLLDALKMLKKRSQDLGHQSGEQVEAVSNLGSSLNTTSKGSSANQHLLSSANTSTDVPNEFDTSISTLNTAVVFFHLHEYENALAVLEPLFQNIEPIDETTALHICLLLLDVALASHNASKAADVIQYLEKAFGVGFMIGQADNGATSQHLSLNQAAKASSVPANLPTTDPSDLDSSTNSSENPLARTLSDETLDYENLLSRLDISVQNTVRPSFSSSNALGEQPLAAVDLKLKLHLYKVRFLLLTRNLKAAKREVKLALNIARGRDSSTALLLKSHLEYARGNHRKAVKLLMTSNNRTDAGIPSMFNNNLGCIYHQLQKHYTSTVFFSKALKSSSSLQSEKPLKLYTFSQDKSLLIVYNCGLEYLACGKPVVAARCFQRACLVFYNKPLLWVRLAECCLLALEKGLLKSGGAAHMDEVTLYVVGKGKWRQVVVEDANLKNRSLSSPQEDILNCGDQYQQQLSLPYARQCLLNALHLLNYLDMKSSSVFDPEDDSNRAGEEPLKGSNHKKLPDGDSKGSSNATLSSNHMSSNGDSKEFKGSFGSNTALQTSVTAYEEMCRKENHILKQAILANVAYVELNLENPLKALSAAKTLLQLPNCSRIYIFLGNVYAAEALCRLNRPEEAAEQLSIYVSDGVMVELPYSKDDSDKWRVERVDGDEVNGLDDPAKNPVSKESSEGIMFLKPEESRGVLYVNLAAISAMQGNPKQAHWFMMQALALIPNNPIAILGAVYVDLLLGEAQEALVKLKECRCVRFFPSGVTTH